MEGIEIQNPVRSEFADVMATMPSKNVVEDFLFKRANVFLRENSAKHEKSGQILVPRKARRKAAREMAKRLTKSAFEKGATS